MIFRRENSVFLKIITYLNTQPIGLKFSAHKVSAEAGVKQSSVHSYCGYFSIIGFIKKTEFGNNIEYELMKHFPDTLNTTIMHEIINEIFLDDTWQNWFMEIDDRIQMKYNERYANNEDKEV